MKEYKDKIVNAAKAFDAERKNFRAEDLSYVAETANEYERARHRAAKSGDKAELGSHTERYNTARGIAAVNYKRPKKEG